jgi:hypothetical protein
VEANLRNKPNVARKARIAQAGLWVSDGTAAIADNATNPIRHYRGGAEDDSLMRLGGFAATLKI